ncbi:phage major capsid protein [Paenibacillus azoreducens]|uniref:phage major capsid protein n=1 Tax=Paenibacillus azoreducens TaxID=116718 RepID=UPI0039F4D45F
MALRQLMLSKKIEQRKAALAELVTQEEGFNTRSAELESAIDEAQNDEEIAAVEEEVGKLDGEKSELAEKKSKLEGEIAELEGELEQLNSKAPSNDTRSKAQENERGGQEMNKRTTNQDYFTREVEDFYSELRSRLKTRANGNVLPAGESGAELIIPDIIVNRIRERIGDYTTLYPLVDIVRAGGRVKLILDVDTKEAEWVEMRGALKEEDDSKLTAVEFDGFKVGRVVYIDNSLLEDSIINLDDYLTKRIARSIAKALDKAILVGTGSKDKQPEGILPAIPAANKKKAKADYKELIPLLGLIDTGEDATGEIICVVHRQTYYAKLATLSLHVNSEGKDVVMLPNLAQPNFLGLRVEFNNYLPKDNLLFGVFDKYTLIEREGTRIDMSAHYKFREDQTAIRGLGRYDGKPVMPESFVLVDISDPANP